MKTLLKSLQLGKIDNGIQKLDETMFKIIYLSCREC